ncbi:MAG: ABC transporter permease [Candidatus Caldarchaeum sp.]
MVANVDALFLGALTITIGSMLRIATPILFTALGENFSQSSGIINLGSEGIMLFAAFSSFITAINTGSIVIGLIVGILVGTILSALFCFITVTLNADQIVTGIALTMISIGATSYMIRAFYGTALLPRLPAKELIALPLLSEIPLIGETLFVQPALVWIGIILVPICHFVLYRSSFGLKLRALSQDPRAAELAGVKVHSYRYVALLVGGIFAGVGGSYLSLYHVSTFIDNITLGRGWIAVAIVMFGQWRPLWILIGALIYAGAEALSGTIQALGLLRGVPPDFLLAFPYIVVIIALVLFARRASFPPALGKPYRRESR